MPEVDKLLAPYAEKTYVKNRDRYIEMGISEEKAEAEAMKDVRREFEQGFQGWGVQIQHRGVKQRRLPLYHRNRRTGNG